MDEEKPSFDFLDETPEAAPAKPSKAVALTYDKEQDEAPRIAASGQGAIADQILALAFSCGVRVREDADLVEVLSKIELDSVIPLEAFAAVAEILNYVYRANAIYGDPRTFMQEGQP